MKGKGKRLTKGHVFLPQHDKIFGVPARVDGTPKGDGARHETRWKRKTYQKFCEYM